MLCMPFMYVRGASCTSRVAANVSCMYRRQVPNVGHAWAGSRRLGMGWGGVGGSNDSVVCICTDVCRGVSCNDSFPCLGCRVNAERHHTNWSLFVFLLASRLLRHYYRSVGIIIVLLQPEGCTSIKSRNQSVMHSAQFAILIILIA